MILNKTNGEFCIDKIRIWPGMSLHDLLNGNEDIFKLLVENNDYISFGARNLEGGEYGIGCYFYQSVIWILHIQLGTNYHYLTKPFEPTEEERNMLKIKLETIGGKQLYQWGDVCISEDRKAGSVSIYIKYS